MWGKIIIPMYRLWLNGLYGLYGPRCPLSSKRPINLISFSLWKTSNELCGTVCTITLSAAVEKACKAFSLRNSFAGSVGIRTSRLIISSFIKINYRVPGITRQPMCHHLQTAMQRHSIRMNCSAPILFYLWPLLLTLFNFNPSMEK